MTKLRYLQYIQLGIFLLLRSLTLVGGEEGAEGCSPPSVPVASTYLNVTKGLNKSSWKIKYVCDKGYELFGSDERECKNGIWEDKTPSCLVNIARYKPATSSSMVRVGGKAGNAVDGDTSTVHENGRCFETESETSPWWAVDLIHVAKVNYVRITTRCCDDIPVKNLEIRVGDSETYKDNPLCNWIPETLPQGSSRTVECVSGTASGRYVSLSMTGVTGVLSLCEVEIFSQDSLSSDLCLDQVNSQELSVYDNSCYWFVSSGSENQGLESARNTCGKVGYDLAYDIDQQASRFLKHRIQGVEPEGRGVLVWLGVHKDQLSDTWRWNTGNEVEKIFWGKQQPNNYANEQDCAVLDSDLDWMWNDISCKVDARTVCKGGARLCPSPRVLEGTWVSGDREEGSRIRYHCPVGHLPIGKQDQECSDGLWSSDPITCRYVECGDVPGLEYGAVHVLDGRTSYGSRVKYECKADYSLTEGARIRTCEEGGWSGEAPRCEFTRCPAPEEVPNASVQQFPGPDGLNRLGSKLMYTCLPGHVSLGTLSLECLIGGRWSGKPPVCKHVNCGEPPIIQNAIVDLLDGSTTYQAKVRYSCEADYKLRGGDGSLRCEANGKWTRVPDLRCEIIECPAPQPPAAGMVNGHNYSVGRKIEYSCIAGHKLEGEAVLRCQQHGDWSSNPPRCTYVDCGRIPRVLGGSVSYLNKSTHLASVAQLDCKSSYKISGSSSWTCDSNGFWLDESGGQPEDTRCLEVRCALPHRPNNTVVSISSTERLHGTSVIRSKLDMAISYKVGSQLKYRCERGFVLSGGERTMARDCLETGEWTGEAPTCSYVDCGVPPPVENGQIELKNNDKTDYGAMAYYSCDLGWRLEGFDKRSCKANGEWTPSEPPYCKETLCKELFQPENGMMNITTRRIGGQASFKCAHGYSLQGLGELECLSSGDWSGWTPVCREVDCKQPLEVENGKILLVDKSTKYLSSAEYHCNPGFVRSGPFTRICEIQGYWSGDEPSCRFPVVARPSFVPRRKSTGGSSSAEESESSSSAGVWIGVALGVIVILGLMVVGIYFYRKQQNLQTKPSRDSNANGLGHLGIPSYVSQTFPDHHGARPPPPSIQMYSMEEPEDPRGPIYDTIPYDNEDNAPPPPPSLPGGWGDKKPSTFSTSGVPVPPGYNNNHPLSPTANGTNGAAVGNGNGTVGTVTINGIAV